MKVDVGLTGVPLPDVAARTQTLAVMGADGVYCAEGPHDIFVPLTLAAGMGTGLGVMTNAAVAFPRNPIHLAHAAYDLQLLSGGTFRLGLAPQVPAHITRRFGLEWSQPVDRMRELVAALRAIFTAWQESCSPKFVGRFYRHTLMTPMFDPGPTALGAPPILLGALGPRMTAMTAEVADGLVILPFNSRRSLRELTLPAMQDGLAERDAALGACEVVCGVIVGVGDDAVSVAQARAAVRSLLGFYGSTAAYRRVLEAEGAGSLQPELAAVVRQGGWAALGDHLPDELVDALAVCGTPEQCAQLVRDKVGDVASRVALFTPGQPDDATLGRLVRLLRD